MTCVPNLNWLSTYGDSRDQALQETRDASVGYFEAAAKESMPLPPRDVEPEVVDLESTARPVPSAKRSGTTWSCSTLRLVMATAQSRWSRRSPSPTIQRSPPARGPG